MHLTGQRASSGGHVVRAAECSRCRLRQEPREILRPRGSRPTPGSRKHHRNEPALLRPASHPSSFFPLSGLRRLPMSAGRIGAPNQRGPAPAFSARARFCFGRLRGRAAATIIRMLRDYSLGGIMPVLDRVCSGYRREGSKLLFCLEIAAFSLASNWISRIIRGGDYGLALRSGAN